MEIHIHKHQLYIIYGPYIGELGLNY